MDPERVVEATGQPLDHWFSAVREAGLDAAPHPEIASFLASKEGINPWWAQEITVAFEKETGRRVTGQTADGLFQVGVSKTINAPAAEVWKTATSPSGLALFLGEEPAETTPDHFSGKTSDGVEYEVTTYVEGSHLRMRFKLPEWADDSILQIRVSEKKGKKSVVTCHQEKLPDEDARKTMRKRWRQALSNLSG